MPLLALALAALVANSPPNTDELLGRAAGAAVGGDAATAIELLKDVDASALPEKDRNFVICMRERFGEGEMNQAATSPHLADRAIALYRSYWRSAVRHPNRRAAEEIRLEARLRELLGAPANAKIDALEPILAEALKNAGLHSIQGRTGLLRELMVWSRQEERTVRVELPGGPQDVKVVLLDDFKSMGWGYFAACGRRGAGGWATKEALYAIVPRYDRLEHEEFRVSFLGHEAQHFADLTRFPDLQPWELEYRAKLTEVALASTTRNKVLRKFTEDQGDDPKSPHSYANRRLLGHLAARLQLTSTEQLFSVELPRLQSAARELLVEDTHRRSGTLPQGAERG